MGAVSVFTTGNYHGQPQELLLWCFSATSVISGGQSKVFGTSCDCVTTVILLAYN